jgi:hypothetical protein
MRDCVDEGILQSYFDGELSIDMMERVSSHLTGCLNCKRAARELENETLLLSEALEPEFSLPVPTDQLRARIDGAIAERRLLNPPRPSLAAASLSARQSWWESVSSLFTLSPQRMFAYYAVAAVILFAVTFAFVKLRTPQRTPNKDSVALVPTPAPENVQPQPVQTPAATGSDARQKTVPPKVLHRSEPPRYVAANYRRNNSKRNDQAEVAGVKLLPGERSYLKTIAVLDSSLKLTGKRAMRPALQSEYERNLAMVDRAIAATRNAAKNNPNDPEATEFMFAAYQTKVDLLNQVAQARLPNRPQ